MIGLSKNSALGYRFQHMYSSTLFKIIWIRNNHFSTLARWLSGIPYSDLHTALTCLLVRKPNRWWTIGWELLFDIINNTDNASNQSTMKYYTQLCPALHLKSSLSRQKNKSVEKNWPRSLAMCLQLMMHPRRVLEMLYSYSLYLFINSIYKKTVFLMSSHKFQYMCKKYTQ